MLEEAREHRTVAFLKRQTQPPIHTDATTRRNFRASFAAEGPVGDKERERKENRTQERHSHGEGFHVLD